MANTTISFKRMGSASGSGTATIQKTLAMSGQINGTNFTNGYLTEYDSYHHYFQFGATEFSIESPQCTRSSSGASSNYTIAFGTGAGTTDLDLLA